MSDVSHSKKKPITRKWLIGAVFSFLVPAIIAGIIGASWWHGVGIADADRWSHLGGSLTAKEQQELMLFSSAIGSIAGLLTGAAGLVLYYLFTRCRAE